MLENTVLVILLATGCLVIATRPLSRFFKSPLYWDVGLGTGVLIVFIIYLMMAVINPIMTEEDLAKEPCGSQSPQGACYKLESSTCKAIWGKSVNECKQEFANEFKARPTALIGPAINRCAARKMDKSVHYNRVNSATNYCKSFFKYLEGLSERSPSDS